MSLKEELLNGERLIGIWGVGYIGFSSMANFAASGVKCLGTDTDPDRVDKINQGDIPLPNMGYWLGFDTATLVKAGMMRATTMMEPSSFFIME